MRKRLVTATLLMLAIAPAAMAQTGSSSSNTQGPLPAPTGHRQPRADQVPQGKDSSPAAEAMKREDEALDRKLKSICRGC